MAMKTTFAESCVWVNGGRIEVYRFLCCIILTAFGQSLDSFIENVRRRRKKIKIQLKWLRTWCWFLVIQDFTVNYSLRQILRSKQWCIVLLVHNPISRSDALAIISSDVSRLMENLFSFVDQTWNDFRRKWCHETLPETQTSLIASRRCLSLLLNVIKFTHKR